MSAPNAKQSTGIAVAFIVLVGAIAVTALIVYENVDDFLKVWAVIGTLVGVVTGAIPSVFFGTHAANVEKAREDAEEGRVQAEEARAKAEEKAVTVLAAAPEVLPTLQAVRPDMFPPPPEEEEGPGPGVV